MKTFKKMLLTILAIIPLTAISLRVQAAKVVDRADISTKNSDSDGAEAPSQG